MILDSYFATDKVGKTGGFALLYSNDIDVQLKSYNRHHIGMHVQHVNGKFWRCTGV